MATPDVVRSVNTPRFFNSVCEVARERSFRLDPERPIFAIASDGGCVSDGGWDGPGCEREAEGGKVGELQDHASRTALSFEFERLAFEWRTKTRVKPPSPILVILVPKLCLGTHAAKLCFASGSIARTADAKRSFADVRSQAELGNEGCQLPCAPALRSASG